MTKMRLTLTLDYDANPEHYPGCANAEDMAAMDHANAEEILLMEIQRESPTYAVTITPIDDKDD